MPPSSARKPASVAPEIPIREIRGQRVLLDSDLAAIYGVPTKALNQAVKRNADRFPEEFLWQLTHEEWNELMNRSQIATLNAGGDPPPNLRSQIVTSSSHGDRRALPYVFTEHGALQAANILRSERAVAMSVFVIRAFVQMRAALSQTTELAKKLAELDHRLTARLDVQEGAIVKVMRELIHLLTPVASTPAPAQATHRLPSLTQAPRRCGGIEELPLPGQGGQPAPMPPSPARKATSKDSSATLRDTLLPKLLSGELDVEPVTYSK